jgi:hypothetical protein
MMEAASTSETSVKFYQTTRRNISEDSHRHTKGNENLKSDVTHAACGACCLYSVTLHGCSPRQELATRRLRFSYTKLFRGNRWATKTKGEDAGPTVMSQQDSDRGRTP